MVAPYYHGFRNKIISQLTHGKHLITPIPVVKDNSVFETVIQ